MTSLSVTTLGLVAAGLSVGCSDDRSSDDFSMSGGASFGGSLSTGGVLEPASGGLSSGGSLASGGAPATGGVLSSGGATAGGGVASGGVDAGSGGTGAAPSGGAGGEDPGSGGAGAAPPDGAPGSDGAVATQSEGCGMSTQQQTGVWMESRVSTDAGSRPYSTWLPGGYDPERAYPVILLLHGCGSGTNNLPMENQVGTEAIVLRGTGSDDNCWDASPSGPDVAFIDAMVSDVKARFCTDTSEFFAVGYSSGSWLANQLGCIRADVFRGLATVTGGLPGVSNCEGQIAQIFIHDVDDTTNLIEWSEPARDRLIEANQCDDSQAPLPVDPTPCVKYQGCDPGYPIIWCATSGQQHSRQDSFAAPAFWNFFQELIVD